MFCKECGKEIAEGMKFCSFCGASVPPAEGTPQNSQPAQQGYVQSTAQPQYGQAQPQYSQQAAQPQYGQAQPQYGQAQPQYGQAQPQYGQAQPQYGQAQPQYGQAQPQYGQAQPQYGQAQPQYGQFGAMPKKKGKGPLIGGIIGGLVAVAGIVVLILALTGAFGSGSGAGSYKSLVEKYTKAMMVKDKSDVRTIMDLLPPGVVEYELERSDEYSTKDELIDQAWQELEKIAEQRKDVKISNINIDDEKTKDLDEDEIKDIQEKFKDKGIEIGEIKAAKRVYFEFDYELNDQSGTENQSLEVIQIDGSWYLNETSLF